MKQNTEHAFNSFLDVVMKGLDQREQEQVALILITMLWDKYDNS
jgi:hypothetical protein